jgi:molybdate/tungstate transport system permease protein
MIEYTEMKQISLLNLLFSLLGALILLFILLPVGKIILTTEPALLLKTALEKEVINSIVLTLTSALWATLIVCISGIPLSYLLARKEFPGKVLIDGLIDLPVVVPHTSAGIALLLVFGRRYWAGKLFGLFGIQFVGAVPGIVIAMMFVSAPFLINYAREGFSAIDIKLENSARMLGASPWQVFWHVSLPLAKKSILTGMLMMWARGISEFGAVIILAYHPMVAPVLVYERFESYGLAYAKPVAALLLIFSLIIFVIARAFLWSKKDAEG